MKEFHKIIEEKKIDYIQFQYTDILGNFKGVDFPVEIWEDMKYGTGIDGSSVGFVETEQSDMKIVPDLDTFAILPWNPKIGRFICNLMDNEGNPHPTCPRSLLIKIMKQSEKKGYEFQIRPELEWYILKKNFEPADSASYMDLFPKDPMENLRRKVAGDMIKMGIDVKTIHHENGPGQHEIEFNPNNALIQSDNIQTAKLISKIEAYREGFISTYMPKPIAGKAGSGLHIHQYLTKKGKNAFSNEDGGVSSILRFFIGGIQKHVKSISAILNPITNSYKRLVAHYEAPVYVSWGVGNRTALIRVPGYEKSARIEYRAGDGAMNIYLGSAVMLAAGMDGIEKEIEPNKPTKKNIYHMSEEERKDLNIESLPRNLEESLEYFENSNFLKKVLGTELFTSYLNKKKEEIDEYKRAKSNNTERNWEFNSYLYC